MPSTWNTGKKAPPRANASSKSKRNEKPTKKVTQSRKRAATDSESDGESQSDLEPTAKIPSRKKARNARRNKTPSDEDSGVEEVDDVNPAAPTPEVISNDEDMEAEVSKKKRVQVKADKSTRGMALTSINAVQSLKKNP